MKNLLLLSVAVIVLTGCSKDNSDIQSLSHEQQEEINALLIGTWSD